ncbi:MAG: Uma2 family endonuclease, partial [Armatimonadaceae bacterium]
MSTLARPITTAELLAMPDDGKRRWLINGELREQEMETTELAGRTMTIRNRFHSEAMANVTTAVNNWRYALPEPRGRVVCGEAGVRLSGDPPTTVGVAVAYVPPGVMVEQTEDSTIIHGVPTLVVEILSPNDTVEQLDEMVTTYLAAGVPLVWVVDPHDRTVTIYQPGDEPTLVN